MVPHASAGTIPPQIPHVARGTSVSFEAVVSLLGYRIKISGILGPCTRTHNPTSPNSLIWGLFSADGFVRAAHYLGSHLLKVLGVCCKGCGMWGGVTQEPQHGTSPP